MKPKIYVPVLLFLAALIGALLWFNHERTFESRWGWEPTVGGAIDKYEHGRIRASELEQVVAEQFERLKSHPTAERSAFVIFVSSQWLAKDRTAAGPVVATVEMFQKQPEHTEFADSLLSYAKSADAAEQDKHRLEGLASEIRK